MHVLDKALNTLGLQVNEIKSVAMLIPPQSDKSGCKNCKIVLRGSELNLVSETRLLGVIRWISFVLRKTLFDFIKSCGGQIRLKFSEVALLGLLYSPK